jgi:antitoxin component of MazEF toxin-antitoxin module
MEATVIKIGNSLGVRVPEIAIKDFNLKVGTKIEMTFIQDGKFVFREKSKIREGWNSAFAQYSLDGEDKPLLPDFIDYETDAFI